MKLSRYVATVNNPGCNNINSTANCLTVTWSLSTTLTGIGTITSNGPDTGVYTAPATVPSPSTVIITATSASDTSVTATATVTVVTAAVPTVTSVSPNTTALGGLFQDVYITGTNFISTNHVFLNGAQLPASLVTDVSSSVIRARIPDYILSVPPPSGSSPDRGCRADRHRGNSNLHGGRVAMRDYGDGSAPRRCRPFPGQHPARHIGGPVFQRGWWILWNGEQSRVTGRDRNIQRPASRDTASAQPNHRQHAAIVGKHRGRIEFERFHRARLVSGCHQKRYRRHKIRGHQSCRPADLQRQSDPANHAESSTVGSATASAPNDVAINPATGMAVVANTGSNDISLIDLTSVTPAKLRQATSPRFLQTFARGPSARFPPARLPGPRAFLSTMFETSPWS